MSVVIKSYDSVTEVELVKVASDILQEIPASRVFLFSGQMGSGKTTLIKQLCKVLGVTDNVNSPTFTLVNEYATSGGEPVYHFDLYRLEKETEALDFGMEDYLCSGHYCFIEWPEKASQLMPTDAALINIVVNNQARNITIAI
jgi:tRNA threonylcarbamoyladenosine biosynthesis protein TsaE